MIDTIIVGAGPSGLCAAKTILQCDPNAQFEILDAGKTIGGAWAKENLYPLLQTNHHFGGVGFSDFPMPEGEGAQPGKHIPGTVVHEFLSNYTKHFNLEDKIQFNTKVLEVTKLEAGQGWELTLKVDGKQQTRQCRKLIIGTGMNSTPYRAKHRGASSFKGPILHSQELGMKAKDLFADKSIETVGVLGGSKSAYDSAYLAAMSGRQVEWIIRKTGRGPVWVFPLMTQMGPFEAQRDRLIMRRILTFFSPCFWNDGYAWIRSWIHGTAIGRFLAQKFWTQMHVDTIRDCKYRTHEKLKVLEPETSPFWYGTVAGAYGYDPDLWEFIRNGQIRVYREDISHLSEDSIHLANGTSLKVDAFILATGYSAKPTIQFNPPSLHSSLGIPSTDLDKVQEEFWTKLDSEADQYIGERYPRLLSGPFKGPGSNTPLPYHEGLDPEKNYTPFRLYRSIAPPGLTADGDRSLVFIGAFSNISNFVRLELQCLWAYAYLNKKMDIDEKKVYGDTALMSRYNRHRAPFGHGKHYPDHVWDQIPYLDVLVQDLGLNPWRKGGMLTEIFGVYTAMDYKGLAEEWLKKTQSL